MVAYRHLGSSGLKITEITYGNWLTHGSQVESDTAIECVLGLLHSCLGIEELRDQCELEGRRRNAPFVRRCVDGLADYVERTAFRETGRPVGSAGSRADDARRP